MMSTTGTLAERRPALATLVGVVGFAAALAAASQIAIPLPGTPVPLTLQPMLVVIAGIALGPAAAAALGPLTLVGVERHGDDVMSTYAPR